jgi:hypothetical protein
MRFRSDSGLRDGAQCGTRPLAFEQPLDRSAVDGDEPSQEWATTNLPACHLPAHSEARCLAPYRPFA